MALVRVTGANFPGLFLGHGWIPAFSALPKWLQIVRRRPLDCGTNGEQH